MISLDIVSSLTIFVVAALAVWLASLIGFSGFSLIAVGAVAICVFLMWMA